MIGLIDKKRLEEYSKLVKDIAAEIYDLYEDYKHDEDYKDKIADELNKRIDIPFLPESAEAVIFQSVVDLLIDNLEDQTLFNFKELLW